MNMVKTLASATLAFCCLAAFGQGEPPSLTVNLPANAKAGATVKATLTLTFADGLHGYQNPPSDPDLIPVAVSVNTKGVKLKNIAYPAGKAESVGGDPKPVKVYEGTIKIPVVVVLPKTKGNLKIRFDAHYQECNDQSCFPPSDVFATATVKVK